MKWSKPQYFHNKEFVRWNYLDGTLVVGKVICFRKTKRTIWTFFGGPNADTYMLAKTVKDAMWQVERAHMISNITGE